MKTMRWVNPVAIALVLFGSVAVSSCNKDDDNTTTSANYTLSGNGSGTQMVPSVSGSGSSTFTGTYNPNTRVMTYTTTWSGLSGAPTSGGFYSGSTGIAGTSVGTPWTMGT